MTNSSTGLEMEGISIGFMAKVVFLWLYDYVDVITLELLKEERNFGNYESLQSIVDKNKIPSWIYNNAEELYDISPSLLLYEDTLYYTRREGDLSRLYTVTGVSKRKTMKLELDEYMLLEEVASFSAFDREKGILYLKMLWFRERYVEYNLKTNVVRVHHKPLLHTSEEKINVIEHEEISKCEFKYIPSVSLGRFELSDEGVMYAEIIDNNDCCSLGNYLVPLYTEMRGNNGVIVYDTRMDSVEIHYRRPLSDCEMERIIEAFSIPMLMDIIQIIEEQGKASVTEIEPLSS